MCCEMSIGRFDTHDITRHTTLALWISFTVTVILGAWSAVCPPKGIIDKSILEFGALLFGFATLAVVREAVKEGLGIKYTHGEDSIEISDINER